MLNCGDFQVHTNNQPNNARIFKTAKLSECTYPLTIASNTNTHCKPIIYPVHTQYTNCIVYYISTINQPLIIGEGMCLCLDHQVTALSRPKVLGALIPEPRRNDKQLLGGFKH